jgi:taurine dioxygenase
MAAVEVHALACELSFGAWVTSVTREALQDTAVRAQLKQLFADRGVIHFAGVEPTADMHVMISEVFGPLKEHPVASVDQPTSKAS